VSCLIWDVLSILTASVRAAVSCIRIVEEYYHLDRHLYSVFCECIPVDSISSLIYVFCSKTISIWLCSAVNAVRDGAC
jgi:hypothetical protein